MNTRKKLNREAIILSAVLFVAFTALYIKAVDDKNPDFELFTEIFSLLCMIMFFVNLIVWCVIGEDDENISITTHDMLEDIYSDDRKMNKMKRR